MPVEEGSIKWFIKNSNGPDKSREDLLTYLRQEILLDPEGLGGELRNCNERDGEI